MVASRVFVTLGLVALLLAILFLLIYIYVTQARNVTLLLVVAACGGAGGCRWVQVGAGGCRWVQVGAVNAVLLFFFFWVELDMPLRAFVQHPSD